MIDGQRTLLPLAGEGGSQSEPDEGSQGACATGDNLRLPSPDPANAGPPSPASGRGDAIQSSPLLPLLIWLSPAFPVGAFAYSHGLEWAVECGDVGDAASVQAWIADLVAIGSIRNDCILLAATMQAGGCDTRVRDINDLALALSPSRERHLETVSQGNAFRDLVTNVWSHPQMASLAHLGDVAYPVALGVAASAHGVPVGAAAEAFALAFVSNLVSAAVRLGPIGQTDAQRIIAALLPDVRACATRSAASTREDLGSACFRADIASMRHETQYSRLFRS